MARTSQFNSNCKKMVFLRNKIRLYGQQKITFFIYVIFLSLFFMSGCATVLKTGSNDAFTRRVNSSFDKVANYLEKSFKEKNITYHVEEKNDNSIVYKATIYSNSYKTTDVWYEKFGRLASRKKDFLIEILRRENNLTDLKIVSETGSIFSNDSFTEAKNIFDELRVSLEESDVQNKQVSTTKGKDIINVLSDVDINIPKTNFTNSNAIAVIIGNKDYKNRDVPSVEYALNDINAVKEYLINVLGYRDGNVLYELNASKATFESIFGNDKDYQGRLFNYLKKGQSDIFIYYSGHGAPDLNNKNGYFVPVDADPQNIKLTGYPLQQLYDNIASISKDLNIPNVTIIIDACFSGITEKGLLFKNASPVVIEVKNPLIKMMNTVVITSSSGAEISSWYPEKGHSMFTYFFLKGLKQEIEKGSKKIKIGEIFDFISDEASGLPYYARRLHGRIQTPQFIGNKNKLIIDQ